MSIVVETKSMDETRKLYGVQCTLKFDKPLESPDETIQQIFERGLDWYRTEHRTRGQVEALDVIVGTPISVGVGSEERVTAGR